MLYGPTVDRPAEAGPDGQIYGTEYLAFTRGRGRVRNVTVMVQVPDFFGRTRPSALHRHGTLLGLARRLRGDRDGGRVGPEEGLRRRLHRQGHRHRRPRPRERHGHPPARPAGPGGRGGCRVRTSPHRSASASARPSPPPSPTAGRSSTPIRAANPEGGWGGDVLRSVEFAFWALERQFGRGTYRPANTLVIGSSVSNGGAASLRAAEQDRRGLIDAVVVSEPNVNPRYDPRFAIVQGGRRATLPPQPAAVRLRNPDRPLPRLRQPGRISATRACRSRRERSPSRPGTAAAPCARPGCCGPTIPPAGRARRKQRINGYGILPEQNVLAPSYWSFYVVQAVALTYANAYARASVTDNLCGYSFAAASSTAPAARIGQRPPHRPSSPPATASRRRAASPRSTTAIQAAPSTIRSRPRRPSAARTRTSRVPPACARSGRSAPQARRGLEAPLRARLEHSPASRQIQANGRLRGVPTIILHGRNDPLIAPNHSSRSYYALNLAAGRQRRPDPLLRGDERAASRCLQLAAGLQQPLHPAAPLLHRGARPDVGASDGRGGAAAQPGGAHDPAGRRRPDHGGERPADRGDAGSTRIRFDGRVLRVPD